ncbi:MAG: hypothetical protein II622_03195, partial [Thermoguttaceae bacterium]|nr:hypothetical protein [Thermoguttaceae bacterium]
SVSRRHRNGKEDDQRQYRAQTKYEIAPTHENLLNQLRLDGENLILESDNSRCARVSKRPNDFGKKEERG